MHLQSTYTPNLQHIQSGAHLESSRTSAVELFYRNSQRIKTVGYFRRRVPSWTFDRILNATLPNNSLHSHQKSTTFPGMFAGIPWNVLRTLLECLAIFPGMFKNIPWNVRRHSSECLAIFPGI